MKNLKSYEEYLVEATPNYTYDGNQLKLGDSVATMDGFSGVIVSKEIINGKVVFRDSTGVLHVCESQYMFHNEKINEDLQWWEVTKGILAADIIKAGIAFAGGGVLLGAYMFSSWREAIAAKKDKLEKLKKDESIKAAAHKIADKFNNDNELAGMLKELDQFPYMKIGLMPGKLEKKKAEKNNAERNKILRNIAKYVKGKLDPDEVEYFVEVNKILKSDTLTDNSGNKVEEDLQQMADAVLDPSTSNTGTQLNRDPNRTVGTGTYTTTWSDSNFMVKAPHNTEDPSSGGAVFFR
jgi:hypothetical protein